MAINSIITNSSSFVALRNLHNINSSMQTTQNRVSTGLRVSSAADDGANFAIAQGIRTEIKALSAVDQGLNNAKGVGKVALAGATGVSNLIGDIRAKLTELSNEGITQDQRNILNDDFLSLLDQAEDFITNSSFNGVNLLDGAVGVTGVTTLSGLDGGTLTIASHDIETTRAALLAAAPADAAAAQNVLDDTLTAAGTPPGGHFARFETAVNSALGGIGADVRALNLQTDFLQDITAATEEGLGNIVDADMARESARMTSLQVQQQLSVQTLGIINQAPNSMLGLFR
jgi:flagellin